MTDKKQMGTDDMTAIRSRCDVEKKPFLYILIGQLIKNQTSWQHSN